MAEFYSDSRVVTGWLCGMDDYHWKVVTADRDVWLFHKAKVSVRIPAQHTEAPAHIRPFIAPLQDALAREGQQEGS